MNKCQDNFTGIHLLSTEYLYGVEPTHFVELKYEDVIKEKLKLAKIKARDLFNYQVEIEDNNEYLEIEHVLSDLHKAIIHNKMLLTELEDYRKQNS